MKHVITYPGFAEGKDAKGLFTDLEEKFPEHNFHILPFYEETPEGNRVVHSIGYHAQRLQDYMDTIDGEITMLAKCGGSRPAVLIDDEHIARLDKLCLFNPPWRVSRGYLEYQFGSWNGEKQTDGSWKIPRGNDKYYQVTKEYMNDTSRRDVVTRYGEIAETGKLYIVRALNDEMFDPIRPETVPGAHMIDIENGNHHLVRDSRPKVIGALAVHGVL